MLGEQVQSTFALILKVSKPLVEIAMSQYAPWTEAVLSWKYGNASSKNTPV